ncbi:hypothetical protein FF1_019881 [Malus domestica]
MVAEKQEEDPYKELGPIPDLDQLLCDLAGNNHLWFNLDDGMLGDNFFDELPGNNFSDGLPSFDLDDGMRRTIV